MHINKSLKKININYRIKPLLLKQEIDLDETDEETWEKKENKWLPQMMFYHLLSDMLGKRKTWKILKNLV